MNAPEALDPLLRQRGRFKGFLASRLGSERDAEDVLQEGFVKAAQHVGELREGERLTAWFYQVLRRAMIDHVRSRHAARAREDAWAQLAPTGTDEEAERQVCSCFESVLSRMKPRDAELIRRVELHNESVASVASTVGLTPNSVSVALHRARKELRARLEAFCGECAAGACLDCDCPPSERVGPA